LLTRCFVQLVLAFVFVGLIASCVGNFHDDVPLIFAAASLSDVLTESAKIYERETGKRVEFSFGGSITLANQIAKLGAPADGVLFAGDGPAQLITEAGLGDFYNAPQLISTDLVVIGGNDGPFISSLTDLANQGKRVAIGDPELAPAGRYAMRALELAGVSDAISDQLIFTVDVRAALAAVESGNAQYGIVYRTDAITSDTLKIVLEIDTNVVQISYFATGITGAKHSREAQTFLNYVVLEPETRRVFESAGFDLIPRNLGLGSPSG